MTRNNHVMQRSPSTAAVTPPALTNAQPPQKPRDTPKTTSSLPHQEQNTTRTTAGSTNINYVNATNTITTK
jgi:hypothetical protein